MRAVNPAYNIVEPPTANPIIIPLFELPPEKPKFVGFGTLSKENNNIIIYH